MRESFDKAFQLTVGLEGAYSNDPRDPGGETKYGIAKRYHPAEDIAGLTLERAKEIYLNEYWLSSGCDEAPYPLDVILFDSSVNPQRGGNKELIGKNPENWQEFLLYRMARYMRYSKEVYVKGHIFRCLKLFEKLKEV